MDKARILIVEDEAIIAMEIESQLQGLGYEVTSVVDTGEKAIQKAEEDKPDIILTDIRINGNMDGIEAADIIRSRFNIPAIYLTAFADEERVKRAKLTLPLGYLLKPIKEKELNLSLKMALYAAAVEKQRKQAEKNLQENENKYRELFEGISSGVAVYQAVENGEDFIFVDLNKSGEQIDHIKKDAIIGKSVRQIFPNLKQFGLFDVFKRVWQNGKPENYPVSLYNNDRLESWRENYVYQLQTGEIVAIYDDITYRKQAEETIQKKTHDLNERVKELDCFYEISKLSQKSSLSLSEIFQEVVSLISSAWQYPNNTCSRFTIEENVYQTNGFQESKWRQSAKIYVHEKEFGKLEIFYKKKVEEADEGPFLREKRLLLDSVTERLGKTIERYQAEDSLKRVNQELEELSKRLNDENIYLQEEIKMTHRFDKIVGENKKFLEVLQMAERVADSQTTVLILGETGTGKEIMTRIIHDLSPQHGKPLVKVNCATLPANLIESELFGYNKGAFTGAISDKKGRFELADNSTIFLDEIGDLPLELQAKLLRVLQEGEFERLGGIKTLKVNVRVIAATNQNLEKLCEEGKFRSDLFFRLNVFPIKCPPLRERIEDIPLLVNHFIQHFNKKLGKNIERISNSNLGKLKAYYWPGNIRELENVIERSMILSPGNHLELGVWFSNNIPKISHSSILSLDAVQKEHIIHVLGLTNGKLGGDTGAATILGMNRSTLQSRMKKLGIKINRTTAGI